MNTEEYKDFKIKNGVLIKYLGPGGDVVIPDGITTIQTHVFENCSTLRSVVIPSTVIRIGSWAFADCWSLTYVYYKGTIEDWCNISFKNQHSTPMHYADNFYMLDDNGDFYLVTDLNIVIPDNGNTVGEHTFYGFNCITTIAAIPDSVNSIELRTRTSHPSLQLHILKRNRAKKKLFIYFKENKDVHIFYEGSKSEWDEKVKTFYQPKNILFNCTKEIFDECIRI